jgi:uncharacterized peroxidase-related enzyme
MSRLPLHTIETAPESTRPQLTAAVKSSGYLSNLLATLAHAPAALEAYLTLSALNAKSSLTLAEREVVQIVAARIHDCTFCVAGHTALALNKAKLSPDLVTAAREAQPLAEPRLEALARFTEAVIATRGKASDEDLAAFEAAGFQAAQAVDVILGVSLASLCNFTNNFAQPPLNRELENYRFEPNPKG